MRQLHPRESNTVIPRERVGHPPAEVVLRCTLRGWVTLCTISETGYNSGEHPRTV
jgi:hypothetical protein